MSTPGFPGVWDSGYWDNNVWEDVPDQPSPPDDTTYEDAAITHSIEFAVTLRLEEDIEWAAPPPQITPLRNYANMMNDYRVSAGVPVSPPTLDCAVPVLVSVDPKGVAIPRDDRESPSDIDTGATLRWYVADQFVTVDDPGSTMTWWDTTGAVAWNSYDAWLPVLDDDYLYQIPRPNNPEIISRGVLMFNAAYGRYMSTSLSINPINNLDDVEFWLVLWSHPLLQDQQFSSILDNGQAVQGFQDQPFVIEDSLNGGLRQALQRYPDKLVQWDGDIGIPLHWTQVSSSGRPILYRVRFGMHPLMEAWGPSSVHMTYTGPIQPQAPLCSDYTLGRLFGLLDPDTNGGFHLFEINYFDHMLSTADATLCLAALRSCYAITA